MNNRFAAVSLVGFVLAVASTIARYVSIDEQLDGSHAQFIRGIIVMSTTGGSMTAIRGNGNASYTQTNACSSTSVNNNGTNTRECGGYTGFDTTHDDYGL